MVFQWNWRHSLVPENCKENLSGKERIICEDDFRLYLKEMSPLK